MALTSEPSSKERSTECIIACAAIAVCRGNATSSTPRSIIPPPPPPPPLPPPLRLLSTSHVHPLPLGSPGDPFSTPGITSTISSSPSHTSTHARRPARPFERVGRGAARSDLAHQRPRKRVRVSSGENICLRVAPLYVYFKISSILKQSRPGCGQWTRSKGVVNMSCEKRIFDWFGRKIAPKNCDHLLHILSVSIVHKFSTAGDC